MEVDASILTCASWILHNIIGYKRLLKLSDHNVTELFYAGNRISPPENVFYFVSHPQFSTLYIISFVVITFGFVMFNVVPTYSALPGSSSSEDDPNEGSAESSSDHLVSADGDPRRSETLTAVAALWPTLRGRRYTSTICLVLQFKLYNIIF